ncbi:DNA gyrase subunit A [candidate division WWE3 bacterium RIFCSPHIGHO2_12_FULL_38_15]|uniref:DNA gyrase subunit A n=1 Tax=candidate division WWE3 bacterium RIFCSPHIGHO2_02_FULL_38_14 TaxID=1802620 RepID=A0A1F4V6I8_UNCKA|nr:MAG: DNA gyrase subunit A [candidate division WWE3 bacterium RIFCSPHIGHO2_01_FULL_38_45]OGC48885.1 MAG: DNA gyrase subunit A [candidate division WWE3 bacterium RIFCSPHIGHO2_12_FULL_38_15]OGC52817.1 MAG: DNA gyrase subunit A [candidate division WWE3 bacterium RIFCSPHIGHO2_02_FULL_38_14]OGC53190.1 MAG: DNA gyrase subunit A [candidate division WWE3 bacterium RIFCSPLOWO2_01_FULL_37_24]
MKEKQSANNPSSSDSSIIKSDITDEVQRAYLDYAMSVIVSRALPDVRDGLKPVHRRIIYAMYDQKITFSGKYHKSAAVVGEVLKNYHPHGDVAVYDSMVRMGQGFSLRYPLIAPQGNFGNIDGDPPAAMRYTEAKLSQIAEFLYTDIDKNTVDFNLNDLQNMEPAYLPSLLPNLLINGAAGIAVGMATNIPPHNLGEVLDGIQFLIEKADNIGIPPKKDDKEQVALVDFSSDANVEDLVQFIKGPDFPTGGTIYDQKEIIQMYATGKGRVVTRAKLNIEEKAGRTRIIVTEIPYQVNKSTLVAKIADLVKDKRIEGISDLRDESNYREGLRIVIELKKEAVPKKLENQLYKYTQLQSTFNANILALLENEPKLMTLKMILEEFVKHRQKVVVRRTIYLLGKYKEREHILLGLKIALDNLDAVIKLIRSSKDVDTAKKGLMEKFGLSEIQAQAILDMQLRRLAALERLKIEEELKEIQAAIKDFEAILASPKKIIEIVKKELLEIREKFGDERKTKVIKGKVGELTDEDLVIQENCIITISENGYIKRLKEDAYRKQARGGKGVTGQSLKEEDQVSTIRICNTHDYAFFFTNKGRVYKMRIWDIPESSRVAKGTALVNFLNIGQEENMHTFLALSSEALESGKGYLVFCTEQGSVKKTSLEEFANIRSSGILAINLPDGDYLTRVSLSNGDDDILLTTSQGQSIRFSEKDVRSMGRAASGVTGIKLTKKQDDYVVGMVVISKESKKDNLIVVTEGGYGKRTPLDEYKVQGRGGTGILTYKITEKTGKLIAAQAMPKKAETDILIATLSGKVIRLSTDQIPTLGRATQGVRLIRLETGDKVTSVAFLDDEPEVEENRAGE